MLIQVRHTNIPRQHFIDDNLECPYICEMFEKQLGQLKIIHSLYGSFYKHPIAMPLYGDYFPKMSLLPYIATNPLSDSAH